MLESITVKVLKYDGTEYRRWCGTVVRRDGPLIVIEAAFEFDVHHDLLGHIARGTRTVEYYWLDCWYNIFQFFDKDGATKLYYCNVNTPPIIHTNVISYIDLDIDVLVQPDLSYHVLDLEEFKANAERIGILKRPLPAPAPPSTN
jgi:protein associated with RNAse G/E